MEKESLYAECVRLGVPVRNHYSDLYIPVNELTREILSRHPECRHSGFTNQVEGGLWYDCPFQFLPYWESK